jgi:PAS domain S-box-containing protein
LILANAATLAVLNNRIENVIGKTDEEIYDDPAIGQLMMANDRRVMESRQTEIMEEIVPGPCGNRTFLSSKTPYFDEAGDVIGVIGIARDITDRKRSEEVLRESEFFFKESQRAASIGSYKTDFISDKWESSEILDNIFGIDSNYIRCTQGWLDLVHPDDRDMMDQYLREDVIAKRNHFSKEYRIIRKNDGDTRWVHGLGEVAYDSNDIPMTLIGTIQDITERKQTENELNKLNQELETRVVDRTTELRVKDQILLMQSRQAAMGEMIGNIAHQWRQPLNVLGMQLQQLQLFYDLGKFNKELLNKNVAGSMELIQHMSKTIDDFRNFFKPDKEKLEFKVLESINTCLSLMEGNLKNPQINVDVIANVDPIIYGYPNEFAQVILNIMNNARDAFIERNVSEPKVNIKICNDDRCVVVTVTDNAGGIPEDIINKVFDPYFTTKGPQQGTGVGLFMSKAIIEKNMGGRLRVGNISDGAEFRIEVEYGNPT